MKVGLAGLRCWEDQQINGDEWWNHLKRGSEFGFLLDKHLERWEIRCLWISRTPLTSNHWGIGLLRFLMLECRWWPRHERSHGLRGELPLQLWTVGSSGCRGRCCCWQATATKSRGRLDESVGRRRASSCLVVLLFWRDRQENGWNEFEFLFAYKRGMDAITLRSMLESASKTYL